MASVKETHHHQFPWLELQEKDSTHVYHNIIEQQKLMIYVFLHDAEIVGADSFRGELGGVDSIFGAEVSVERGNTE